MVKVFKFYDLLAIICLIVLGTNSLSALDIFLAEDLKTRKNYREVLATQMSGEKPSFAGDMWPDVNGYPDATRDGIKSIQESIRREQQHLKSLVESHAYAMLNQLWGRNFSPNEEVFWEAASKSRSRLAVLQGQMKVYEHKVSSQLYVVSLIECRDASKKLTDGLEEFALLEKMNEILS